MSHGWNLLCTEHDETMLDDDWNRGDAALADLWRSRDLICAIDDTQQKSDQLDVTVEWGYHSLGWHAPRWIRQHRDCPVVLLDEYRNRKDVESMEPRRPHHCPTCTCEPKR